MSTKQKDAVFNAISAVRGTSDFQGAVTLTKEERQTVSAELVSGFQAGTVEYSGEVPTGAELTSYVSGLVSNWLRKDKRLNGNQTYVPKNPGTRTGSGDESVKAMRTLLAATQDPEARAEIQSEIDKRLGELKPKKEINIAALPESLRHLAQQ